MERWGSVTGGGLRKALSSCRDFTVSSWKAGFAISCCTIADMLEPGGDSVSRARLKRPSCLASVNAVSKLKSSRFLVLKHKEVSIANCWLVRIRAPQHDASLRVY